MYRLCVIGGDTYRVEQQGLAPPGGSGSIDWK